jgi:two-component system sensor histidine kinase HydH
LSFAAIRRPLFRLAVAGTTCLLAACIALAVSLHRQQQRIAAELHDQVADALAAANLEESVLDLRAMLKTDAADVTPLHDRIAVDLAKAEQLADDFEERRLAALARRQFDEHVAAWRSKASRDGMAKAVADGLLKTATEFDLRSRDGIENISEAHRLVLRELSWGFAGLGLLASLAGLLVGVATAMLAKREIRRLQVRVLATTEKLPGGDRAIEVSGEGDAEALGAQVDELASRVESTIERLNERDREAQRAERLAAVGRLAAGVAHEIRNPLTSIKMLLQSAMEGGASLERSDLEIAESEIVRIERSLQTFMDFARPPALERRNVELGDLLRRTAALVRGRAERQGVAVRVKVPEPANLFADPEQLQQVFVNIALNALDAMPGGGTLLAGVRRSGGSAVAAFTDTGPGLSADIIGRLFEPFASTRSTGMGLGLAISRRIVESHGGSIRASSVDPPGRGTMFEVELPLAPAKVREE